MPIYEYQCESCKCIFEKLIFRSDDETIECPDCGARHAKRLLSAASFMGGSGLGACTPNPSSGFS
jgi:putative FmdB family regulatory protein